MSPYDEDDVWFARMWLAGDCPNYEMTQFCEKIVAGKTDADHARDVREGHEAIDAAAGISRPEPSHVCRYVVNTSCRPCVEMVLQAERNRPVTERRCFICDGPMAEDGYTDVPSGNVMCSKRCLWQFVSRRAASINEVVHDALLEGNLSGAAGEVKAIEYAYKRGLLKNGGKK